MHDRVKALSHDEKLHVTLHAMTELLRVTGFADVACNFFCNVPKVEIDPTSATLHASLQMAITLRVANGKSETGRDAETGILKSEPETEKFGDLIEKHICDRQTQNLRLLDPLLGCVDSGTWVEFAETSYFSKDHSPPLTLITTFARVVACNSFIV